MHAGKCRLSLSIGLVDHPALRTGPAGVAWINGDDRDAGKLRFICGEPAKLGKRPPMRTAALRLAGLNPVANMRDVFDRNHAAGAFGVRNSFLRYVVVHVLAKAGLLPAQSLKAALCSFGAAALQAGMAARELLSNALDFSIGKGSPFAVIGNVYDAEINALERLRCRFAPGQGRRKHKPRYHLPRTSIRSTSPLRRRARRADGLSPHLQPQTKERTRRLPDLKGGVSSAGCR
jgi:hypothetical protein